MGETSSVQTEEFLLQNGTFVKVRPIGSDDADALRSLFQRLSPESIYLRTLGHRKELTPKEAKWLANVDYHKRMAFVAANKQAEEDRLIAVARYSVANPDQPDIAEVGVVVEDLYQNQGLGLFLLRHLTVYAREQGMRAFVGTVSLQNARMMRFIQRSGLPTEHKFEQGAWEIRIDLQVRN